MKFKIDKFLFEGKYLVRVTLIEFTDQDKDKEKLFGTPKIKVKISDGSMVEARVTDLQSYSLYRFFTSFDADIYANDIKSQLVNVKRNWDSLNDNWSKSEII